MLATFARAIRLLSEDPSEFWYRWLDRAGRVTDLRTQVDGLSRRAASEDVPGLVGLLTVFDRQLRLVAPRATWAPASVKVITDYLQRRVDHSTATMRLLDIADYVARVRKDRRVLALHASASELVGLFAASGAFRSLAIADIRPRGQRGGERPLLENRARIAIQSGDSDAAGRVLLDQAQARGRLWEPLQRIDPSTWNYLVHWTGVDLPYRLEGEPAGPAEAAWRALVQDADVHVIGPAAGSPTPGAPAASEVRVRTIRPGETPETRVGAADIGYLNGDSLTVLLRRPPDEVDAVLGRVNLVATKVTRPNPLPHRLHSRVYNIPRAAFLAGQANMIPSIVTDLVQFGPRRIFVSGVNFYVGFPLYSSDEPSANSVTNVERVSLSMLGSLGNHGLFENRRVMKNLFDAGRIGGDEAFTAVLSLEDRDYGAMLDRTLGSLH